MVRIGIDVGIGVGFQNGIESHHVGKDQPDGDPVNNASQGR